MLHKPPRTYRTQAEGWEQLGMTLTMEAYAAAQGGARGWEEHRE